jgi:hypothetical protein
MTVALKGHRPEATRDSTVTTPQTGGHSDPAGRIATEATALQREWDTNPRWEGVERTYTAQDVVRLRGTVREEHTLARRGAERLWELLHSRDYVRALGAITGNQAVQMVRGGLEAIYLSGWQVAADGNASGQTYPDQSLYPVNSVPTVVRRINNALLRADEITFSEATDPGLGGGGAAGGGAPGGGRAAPPPRPPPGCGSEPRSVRPHRRRREPTGPRWRSGQRAGCARTRRYPLVSVPGDDGRELGRLGQLWPVAGG